MEIKLNKNMKISVELPKKMSNKQKWIIKHYSNPDRYLTSEIVANVSAYLLSLSGRRTGLSSFKRSFKDQNGTSDRLANREANHFLNKVLEKYDTRRSKSPNGITEGSALGIEIECIVSDSYSKDQIRTMIMQRRISNVNLKDDGSIRPNKPTDENCGDDDCSACIDGEYCESIERSEYGLEFTIITDINDMSNLAKLCDLLKDIKAYVNKSCGLHVHLDCRDLRTASYNRPTNTSEPYVTNSEYFKDAANKRANKLVWALPLLTKMLPASRLDNTYCKYGKSKGSSRYYMVNTKSLSEHTTLEVRMHSGTTDFTKISSFAKILYAISRAKGVRFKALNAISSSSSLFDALNFVDSKANLGSDLKLYIINRIKQFNPSLFTEELGPIVNEELSEEIPSRQAELPMAADMPF